MKRFRTANFFSKLMAFLRRRKRIHEGSLRSWEAAANITVDHPQDFSNGDIVAREPRRGPCDLEAAEIVSPRYKEFFRLTYRLTRWSRKSTERRF